MNRKHARCTRHRYSFLPHADLVISLLYFSDTKAPRHCAELESRVTRKVTKNTLCTMPVQTLLPHRARCAWLLIPDFPLGRDQYHKRVREECCLGGWEYDRIFSHLVLPFNHDFNCPPLPVPTARCLALSVWHEILQIYIFCRASDSRLQLESPSLGT